MVAAQARFAGWIFEVPRWRCGERLSPGERVAMDPNEVTGVVIGIYTIPGEQLMGMVAAYGEG
ncbi:MAG TPA: hypothetical protein VFI96_01750 [Longimicrobiaceae bacterium]|nr:hypothetical protein [Longimicrobiaceae bacterium]